MGSRAAQPTQVGLFSAQVAEQIQRLKTLTGDRATPSGSEQVDLKRAVMATRLLGGSARILRLEPLQLFLDRLLDWLQGIESGERSLTSTQQLLLESVIELEERLMRHLETNGTTIDLSSFRDDFAEVMRLIERHAPPGEHASGDDAAGADSAGADSAASATPDDSAAGSTAAEGSSRADGEAMAALERDRDAARGATGAAPASDPLVDALGAITVHLEGVIDEGGRPVSPESLIRLRGFLDRMAHALGSVEAPKPKRKRRAAAATDSGWDHPLVAPLRAQLTAARAELRVPICIEVRDAESEVEGNLRELVTQIVGHLLEDVFATFAQSRKDTPAEDRATPGSAGSAEAAAEAPLRITIQLTGDHGRLLVSISDSAPAHPSVGGIDDADHLILYRGLRQSKALVEQLNGLIWVEPPTDTGTRFVLSLPSNLREQAYRVIDLGQVQVAVPWVLVDDVTTTEGLLFHADATGESFHHHGRSIALADLAEYVPKLIPRDDPAEQIAIVGSVEKRLGLFCESMGDFIDASQITTVPAGWERVAYGGLDVGGQVVPLLDIGRVLRLRFSSQHDLEDEAGSLSEPSMDTYMPVEDATPAASAPSATGGRANADSAQPASASATASAPGGDSPDATNPQAAAAGGRPGARDADSGGTRRCLLINQSEFRRRDLARTLEGMGYEVMATAELVRGLHYLDSRRVHLIVTDLRLGERGAEHLARLRDGQIDTPIVLTSSVAREYAEELARKTGADACWLDPFRPADLQAALAALAP